ncbi:MAG: hypothetical protein U1G07_01275 [Verrucomicrobiota bacterium]
MFIGNDDVNSVFFDDIYISKSGYNSTVPRPLGFTTPAGGGGGEITLSIARAGNQIEIQWAGGTLESAADIAGAWSPVTGATTSPYRAAPDAVQRYFRVRK